MASPHDQAGLLIAKAADDWVALQALLEKPQATDEIIGFHGQQVVEKALKAVLSNLSVAFPWKHDLARLVDSLADQGITVPDFVESAVSLTPFAVEFRYDYLPKEKGQTEKLDRSELRKNVERVLLWCQAQVGVHSPPVQ